MERIATLVLKNVDFEAIGDCFACESGALAIINKGLTLHAALGDFDSVSLEDKTFIQSKALKFQAYSSHKDFSDSELAIEYLIQEGYDKIIVYGGLGGRSDHLHVNLILAYKYPQVVFKDNKQEVYSLRQGDYKISKDQFDLFSVFSFEKTMISLNNCEYPLENKKINVLNTLTLSNTWLDTEVNLTVHMGTVIIIKSKNC